MQFENRPPELQMFSIESSIENLMKEYEMAVRNKEFERAQEIVKQINNLDKQKININNKKIGMKDGGTPFPDLTGDGKVTQADILKGRGVYAEGDEVIQNMYLEEPDYRDNIDFSRDMKPGTPEDYEKKIYLLEKEIANQFKEYHGAVEGGFEEQAAASYKEYKK